MLRHFLRVSPSSLHCCLQEVQRPLEEDGGQDHISHIRFSSSAALPTLEPGKASSQVSRGENEWGRHPETVVAWRLWLHGSAPC